MDFDSYNNNDNSPLPTPSSSSDKHFVYTSPNISYLGLDEAIERYFLGYKNDDLDSQLDQEFLDQVIKHRMFISRRHQIIENEHESYSMKNDHSRLYQFLSKYKSNYSESQLLSENLRSLKSTCPAKLRSVFRVFRSSEKLHQMKCTNTILQKLSKKYHRPIAALLLKRSKKRPRKEKKTLETGKVRLPSLPSMLAGVPSTGRRSKTLSGGRPKKSVGDLGLGADAIINSSNRQLAEGITFKRKKRKTEKPEKIEKKEKKERIRKREKVEKGEKGGDKNTVSQKEKDEKLEKKEIEKLEKLGSIENLEKIEANKKRRTKPEKAYEDDRRKLWLHIVKKQIPKTAKIYSQTLSTHTLNCKRLCHLAAREVRRVYFRYNRLAKEHPFKSRKIMREMLTFWKKNEKEEKEMRKKAEKAEIEKRKAEEEARESRRQARKLNFLISQTELYSHFIAKKVQPGMEEGSQQPLIEEVPAFKSRASELDHMSTADLINEEGYDDILHERAKQQAVDALNRQVQRTKEFDSDFQHGKKTSHIMPDKSLTDISLDSVSFLNPTTMPAEPQISQPEMLKCHLKSYQIKGLNWLANLYEQGINGILADEMGLGKTVQSIALMSYLAESQNIWGPFLVIAPASTLHNWQQEFVKFTPDLKPLPYWGSVNDRKVLRRFWTQKNLSTREAPFHVLITSYQLVVTDEKYFQKIKWQYMVLDEAQAIKSSSSVRWKTLLGFNCRNRLLLTGTPIQNSMQELWALLHFIMPTLFDSHDEFSEWFSKDIESHAEHKSGLNERQLTRLHMILKPFMLRRIKKDVENELGDKIEVDYSCELSAKQRRLYRIIRRKVSAEELLDRMSKASDTDSLDSLMNLVMQFRKICNHPELIERSDVHSPFYFSLSEPDDTFYKETSSDEIDYFWTRPRHHPIQWPIPKLILDMAIEFSLKSIFFKLFDICSPYHQYQASTEESSRGFYGLFSFVPFIDLSFSEICNCRNLPLLHSLLVRLRKPLITYLKEYGYENLEHPSKLISYWTTFNKSDLDKEITLILKDKERSHFLSHIPPLYLPKITAAPIEIIQNDPLFESNILSPILNPYLAHQLLDNEIIKRIQSRRFEKILESTTLSLKTPLYSNIPSDIRMPNPMSLINDSGKMKSLHHLLIKLKREGHRVLIYFQMTRMIDLMEDYLRFCHYKYLRLDGSSKISDRRDMVTDWQTKEDIFIFLLSTRAGGLGINLTAADTVIFYDSDWNPTVDQQAMDRAHRLGQTKQVTVYRLITRGTIEERIQQRAQQKHEIQKVVIAGGEFRQVEELRPKEIVSLLLDEEASLGGQDHHLMDSYQISDRMDTTKKDLRSNFHDQDPNASLDLPSADSKPRSSFISKRKGKESSLPSIEDSSQLKSTKKSKLISE